MSSDRPGGPLIAISGKSGCGNTTASRLVADRLGLRVVNYTFKDLARDRGMRFEEVCALAETDPQYDYAIDRLQVKIAREGPCVLGSRLAIWLLREEAFTVYLGASLEVRAARIARRDEIAFEEALVRTRERDRRDHDRYLRLYGYDVDDYRFARLVVDTEPLGPGAVAERIMAEAKRSGAIPPEGR